MKQIKRVNKLKQRKIKKNISQLYFNFLYDVNDLRVINFIIMVVDNDRYKYNCSLFN